MIALATAPTVKTAAITLHETAQNHLRQAHDVLLWLAHPITECSEKVILKFNAYTRCPESISCYFTISIKMFTCY